MLHVDVGNTLRGGLRTGIQRVVRSLAYDLASKAPDSTRLIAFDPAAGRYFALADAELIRSADALADLKPEDRIYFPFDTFARGDIYFEPDSTWSEPLNRGALFRALKAKGVIVVILNHDVIPVLLPEVCHPNTLVSFSEAIADELAGTGVTVTVLCPGPTRTGFQSRAQMEDSKLVRGRVIMSSDEVARIGYEATMKGKRMVIPGTTNRILAQSTRFLPRATLAKIVHKVQERAS